MINFDMHNQAPREFMSPKERILAEEAFYNLHGRSAYRAMALTAAVAIVFMLVGSLVG